MIEVIEQVESNPYFELIDRILHREEKLSVSSFKEFMKSPRHFIRYKLREEKQTDAMLKGSVIHCLILEPDEFDDRYVIEPENAPRKPSIAQINAKNPSDSTLESIAFWDDFNKNAKGREVVPRSIFKTAERVKEYTYKNPAIRYVLDGMHTTEKFVEWELGGYQWHGFVDGIGNDFFVDLKGMRDATPRKAKYTIRDMGYLFQGYLYGLSPECKGKDFFIVALEDMPNGSVIRIDQKTLSTQREEIDYYLGMFKKCTFENAWNRGYDYFTKNGIFNYSYL